MIEFLEIVFSLAPVFLFLAALIVLDSYKLVAVTSVLRTILFGCLAAVLCLFINARLSSALPFDLSLYSRYVSPAIEELAKGVFIIFLLQTKRVGFLVDGAIYGFALGAGFAFVENIYYLLSIQGSNLLLWLIRGFGTAVMHGGTTAGFAILSKSLSERNPSKKGVTLLPGLLAAFLIHSFFNHFFISPLMTTVTQLIALPVLVVVLFTRSEKSLQDWLEIGMDTDVNLLDSIVTGHISETKTGIYLQSLKSRFPGATVADMLCFLRLHLELAIRAKGMLIMRGAGFRTDAVPDIGEKFAEMEFLEKAIGRTGTLAMSPILRTHARDLWQMYLLDKK